MSSINDLTPGTWNIDASHSTVGFTARHLMISKVHGTFGTFSGSLTIAEDRLGSSVTASIDTTSVTTGDPAHDAHIKNEDFLDVEQFPTFDFASKSIASKGSNYELTGDLTIKGVTKPVTMQLEFDGVATDPWGNQKSAFTAETEINRKEFGLEWNVALEAGGVLVGDKIKIVLDIQAVQVAPVAA